MHGGQVGDQIFATTGLFVLFTKDLKSSVLDILCKTTTTLLRPTPSFEEKPNATTPSTGISAHFHEAFDIIDRHQ